MVFDGSELTVTHDGFRPRLELRAGSITIAKTLSHEDMAYIAEAFAKHGAACAAVSNTLVTDDPDLPRWQRRLAARAARKHAKR